MTVQSDISIVAGSLLVWTNIGTKVTRGGENHCNNQISNINFSLYFPYLSL